MSQRVDIPTPSFSFEPTGVVAFDQACVGLPLGALTHLTGRHVIDVDLLLGALLRENPEMVVLDSEYDVVTKRYRTVVEKLRELHGQKKSVIIRCSPPPSGRDFDGEEALLRAVGSVAKMYPRPIVLAWCELPGEELDDSDAVELWMASTNVVTLIHARRADEEDDVIGISHAEMEGDLFFDVTFFDPRTGEVESTSLESGKLA